MLKVMMKGKLGKVPYKNIKMFCLDNTFSPLHLSNKLT